MAKKYGNNMAITYDHGLCQSAAILLFYDTINMEACFAL